MLLKIGELAKRAGLTVRTLHHYDHIGLLSPSARSESGYRLYNQDDVQRLHRIQALKQFGCTLAEIGSFLEEPGASIVAIISRQMMVLKKQAKQAEALHDRLAYLRDRLVSGKNTGLADWLTILEMMTVYDKHLSKKELDTLLNRRTDTQVDVEWRGLADSVADLMARKIPPESPEARDVAWRWMQCLIAMTENNAGLAMKLRRIHREGPNPPRISVISPEMADYLTLCFASARLGVLAEYLSKEELDAVAKRQAPHLHEWPPLIDAIREQMAAGAAPDDPGVQALTHRWKNLFQTSYSGNDRHLEEKIRAAFRREPNLQIGIGIDKAFLSFVEAAATHYQKSRETGKKKGFKTTALRVAIMRAAHQLLDRPLVFEDPLALPILGELEVEKLRENLAHHNTTLLKSVRASVVVRGRLAEDEWSRSQQAGVRQYVILGAGLDTVAYRNRDDDGSRIFEVDLPETQAWKRQCLGAAGIPESDSVTYVPVDFESSILGDALARCGFSASEPAFFSWLGVTTYLAEEEIFETLRFIASLPSSSGVVFDYVISPSLMSERERRSRDFLAARTENSGEPWKTDFLPDALAERLLSLGFNDVVDYGPGELNAKYLAGRSDGIRKSGVSRLVCARRVS